MEHYLNEEDHLVTSKPDGYVHLSPFYDVIVPQSWIVVSILQLLNTVTLGKWRWRKGSFLETWTCESSSKPEQYGFNLEYSTYILCCSYLKLLIIFLLVSCQASLFYFHFVYKDEIPHVMHRTECCFVCML